MNQQDVIKQLVDKTMKELFESDKSAQRSRMWKTPEGYKFLVQWSNLLLLRLLVKKALDDLKTRLQNQRLFSRLEAQIMDALRSCLANLEEGWKRPTTSEYLHFLGYSQASLEEVKGDIQRMLQDGLLVPVKGSSVEALGIDLKSWNTWARDPLNSSKILYFPLRAKGIYRKLEDVKGNEISYEMLVELVNKTDYLMRKFVVSLESKLASDQKYYQVERARIRGNTKGWK